jgi:hypothetical protein
MREEENRAKPCGPVVWALVIASFTIPGLLKTAAAQVGPPTDTFVQVIGPAQASPGEHLSFCFQRVKYKYTPQNPSQGPVDVGHALSKDKPDTATLRILDGITGAEKAKKDITFPVEGSPALPSDPCVEFVVPVVAASSTATAIIFPPPVAAAPMIFIGVVSVSSEPVPPLPPGVTQLSSLDIYVPVFGIPTNVRHVATSATCPSSGSPCVL